MGAKLIKIAQAFNVKVTGLLTLALAALLSSDCMPNMNNFGRGVKNLSQERMTTDVSI